MDLLKFLLISGVFKCFTCVKVYEWTSDWGSDLTTKELAQVHETDQTIIHYSIDESVPSKNDPAVTIYDFSFTNDHFDKGLIIIRPLVSDGNQVCFIARSTTEWTDTVDDVTRRHGTSISAPSSFSRYKLRQKFPLDLDPLSVPSVANFCNVDIDHIFFMDPNLSIKNLRRMKFHGLYGRLTAGVKDDYISTVFA